MSADLTLPLSLLRDVATVLAFAFGGALLWLRASERICTEHYRARTLRQCRRPWAVWPGQRCRECYKHHRWLIANRHPSLIPTTQRSRRDSAAL